MIKPFLFKIYLHRFFGAFIFIYPLYAVMFVEHGLSALKIGIILAVWAGTTVLLEVPSGVLADKYSRKKILFWAEMLQIVGYLFWLFLPNFWGFLIGFVFWGAKVALATGTFEALVYDELKSYRQHEQYTKIIGRAKGFDFLGTVLASLLASAAILRGYSFVLILSLFSLAISAIAIIFLPKVKQILPTKRRGYAALLKEGVRLAVTQKGVLALLIFLSLMFTFWYVLEEFLPIFGEQVGLPKYILGPFIAALFGAQALGSFLAHHFQDHSQKRLYFLFGLNGLILTFAALWFKPIAVLFLFLFACLYKAVEVIIEGALQQRIPTQTRATIFSVRSFLTEMGAIVFALIFGAIAQTLSYPIAFLATGVAVSLLGICFFLKSLVRPERGMR